MIDWLLRFFKGSLIGTGFILPGVSGGALAAIFGLYHRMISFIANITHDFVKNVVFFIPVGLGALFGMFLLARPLSYALKHYEVYVIWGFIGCIVGVFPSLWSEAGKQGRTKTDYIIVVLSTVIAFCLLYLAKNYFKTQLQLNIFTWFLAGMLIALGTLLPGMSPSNFLVYLGMYPPMVEGFKTLDFVLLTPLFIGAFTCLFAFSKLVDNLLEKHYASVFHLIVGIVIASTLLIVPTEYNYLQPKILICVMGLLLGVGLGYVMSLLEEKYKK